MPGNAVHVMSADEAVEQFTPSTRKRGSLSSTLDLYRRLSRATTVSVIFLSEIGQIPITFRSSLGSAAQSLGLIMRNALISTCCAWVITFCISLGDVFSGEKPGQQNPSVFLASMLLWGKVLCWACVSACVGVRLQPHQCSTSSKTRSGFLFWWFKVVFESLPVVIVTSTMMLAIAIGGLKAHPTNTYWISKLNLFLVTVLAHADTTACSVAAVRLVQEETLYGQSQAQGRRLPYHERFLRSYCGFLNVASFAAAALYAHLTNSMHISGMLGMAAFVAGSTLLKVCLQEAVKHMIIKQNVNSITTMAAFIGIPTILIHAHMSIMILGARNLNTTISGTLSTALLEIGMRTTKSWLIRRQIHRESERRIAFVTATNDTKEGPVDKTRNHSIAAQLSAKGMQKLLEHDVEFVTWKTQLLHYYAAEIYIDMFAEYVAMGCSYAILVIFWNHPMFRLGYDPEYEGTTHELSQTLFKTSKILALAVQIGVEVVVDYVACVVETMQGINLRPLHAHTMYLTFFLVWAAVGNITIASHVFFHPNTSNSSL